MKIGLNWGWKITLLYCGFVVMMITLVGMSVSQKIDLVADDYYAMELIHQQKIDKINRAKALDEKVKWVLNSEYLEITFPSDFDNAAISGDIKLYCPSDNKKDASVPIMVNAHSVQRIAKGDIKPGRYHLQVDWSVKGVTYWDEGVINIAE